AQRILDEDVDVVGMIVGPIHGDEEFGLAVDLALLRLGRDDEEGDEEQEGQDLQGLEQHDAEGIEGILARQEIEIVDHSPAAAAGPRRPSSAETTWPSVSSTAKAKIFAVALSNREYWILTRMEAASPTRVVYMATAMPPLISDMEDRTASRF